MKLTHLHASQNLSCSQLSFDYFTCREIKELPSGALKQGLLLNRPFMTAIIHYAFFHAQLAIF